MTEGDHEFYSKFHASLVKSNLLTRGSIRNELCDLTKRWKPIAWGEEAGQIRAGIGPFLEQRLRERRAYVARKSYPARGNKETRAQSIRGRIALDGLYLPTSAQVTASAALGSEPVARDDFGNAPPGAACTAPRGNSHAACHECEHDCASGGLCRPRPACRRAGRMGRFLPLRAVALSARAQR
jgi:hypothetical protein